MTPALTYAVSVAAGLAIVASGLTATRRGLVPGLVAGVTLAIVAALLITAVRAFV